MVEEEVTELSRADQYDLVIIGGGYVGAWLGYLSSKYYPAWRTLIIDRNKFGSGVSYYGADLDFPNNRTAEHKALSAESRLLIDQALADIPDLNFARSFARVVVSTTNDDELSSSFGVYGFTITRMNTISISNYEMKIRKEEFILDHVDVLRACDKTTIKKLLHAARENNPGMCFKEEEEVIAINHHKTEKEIVLKNGKLTAARVVSAVGPWSQTSPWVEELKIKIRLKKIVAFYLLLDPEPGDKLVYLLNDDAFLMPQPESKRWLLSISSNEWDCEPDTSSLEVTAADREIARNILKKYIPDLLPCLVEGRVFCDGYSEQRHPITVAMPTDDTFLFAGCCSGSGFRLSPAIAHRALQMLRQ